MDKTNRNTAYLLTGGNMGDRKRYLDEAAGAVEKSCGRIILRSAIYETEAWGMHDQEPFLNQALCITTELEPETLLNSILHIETELGRRREIKYGPRTIDIDILFYGDVVLRQPGLIIPHPELHNRRFALQCLYDIAPDLLHPVLARTVKELLAVCTDPLTVHKIN